MTIVDPQAAARSAIAGLLGAFGFNPGQKRGPDGRWIKMGGKGSAGKGGLPKGPGARASEGGGAGAGGGAPIASVTPDTGPQPVGFTPHSDAEWGLIQKRLGKRTPRLDPDGELQPGDIVPTRDGKWQEVLGGDVPRFMEGQVVNVRDDSKGYRHTEGIIDVKRRIERYAAERAWRDAGGSKDRLEGRAATPVDTTTGRRPGEPPIGEDGKYAKPTKQYAVWNGRTYTRTSRNPYRYAAVVADRRDPEGTIWSWHRTAESAQRGTLTGSQRQSGAYVKQIVETGFEAPGGLPDAFRFDPNQRRDAEGRWVETPGGGSSGFLEQHEARRQALQDSVASGMQSTHAMGQGTMSEVARARLNDGREVVTKTIKKGAAGISSTNQAKAEVLVSALASALGLNSPAVLQTGKTDLVMELVDGQTGMQYLGPAGPGYAERADALVKSDQGVRLGLLDAITNQADRHPGNWMVDSGENLVPIDNGLSFVKREGRSPFSEAGTNRFVNNVFVGWNGRPIDNPLTPADVELVRQRLETLRPQFEKAKKSQWLDETLGRLDLLAPHARGTVDVIPAATGAVAAADRVTLATNGDTPVPPVAAGRAEGVGTLRELAASAGVAGEDTLALRACAATAAMEMLLAFNPHQRRGPDGRWIKMGTEERKGRRRRRDRARRAEKKAEQERAAKTESDAPDQAEHAYRVDRDAYNHKIIEAAIGEQNDNESDDLLDDDMQAMIDDLREALGRGNGPAADRVADKLRRWLEDEYEYGNSDLPQVPQKQAAPKSVELDEAVLQRQLLDALDDYNSEIYAMGKEWVDMLRDPDVRNDPDSGLDHLSDSFIDVFEARVNALKRAILRMEPDKASEDAAEIRRMLVSERLQADHDFPPKPTIEDLRTQARGGQPAFKVKTSGLLTSGASRSARLAALERAAAGGVWGDEPIGQGAMGETKKVYFNDGTPAIYKRAKGDWNMEGATWTPKDQTDAEEMASLVGAALGLRAPAVQRLSDDEIHMELVENAVPAVNRFFDQSAVDHIRVSGDVMGSDDGLLMGLFDTLIDNPDRHGFNWMVDDDNRIYPIDHGLSFINTRGAPGAFSAASRSPFAREYFITGGGSYKENMLSRRDVQYVRQQLAALEPEFDRVGRAGWYRVMQMRLDAIEARAKGGPSHQLPAPREE